MAQKLCNSIIVFLVTVRIHYKQLGGTSMILPMTNDALYFLHHSIDAKKKKGHEWPKLNIIFTEKRDRMHY